MSERLGRNRACLFQPPYSSKRTVPKFLGSKSLAILSNTFQENFCSHCRHWNYKLLLEDMA